MLVPYWLDYYSFIIGFEMEIVNPWTLFFFKIVSTILGPLYIYMNFKAYDKNLKAFCTFLVVLCVDYHAIWNKNNKKNFISFFLVCMFFIFIFLPYCSGQNFQYYVEWVWYYEHLTFFLILGWKHPVSLLSIMLAIGFFFLIDIPHQDKEIFCAFF